MATLVEANPHNTAVAAVVHPLIVRLIHWVNAGATIVMIMSGWQIHNAYPTLPFSFPDMLTLGDGLAGGLRWHFAAMWVLLIQSRHLSSCCKSPACVDIRYCTVLAAPVLIT